MIELYKKRVNQAVSYLQESDIDLWLIYSSEGSDPLVRRIFGLRTVGNTFFLISKEGKKYALASVIDALDSENSELFDKVITYKEEPDHDLLKLMDGINPSSIALNYSKENYLFDGLTVGRYRWLSRVLDPWKDKFLQSEMFLRGLIKS